MKLGLKTKILFGVVSAVFMLYSLTLIFPFLYTLNNSFKTNSEFILNVWSIPKRFGLDNYFKAFKDYNILRMFFNTIVLTVGGTTISVMSACIMAYIMAKYKFPGSSVIFTMAIIFMVVPNLGNVAAIYKMVINMGIIDNLFGVLILYGGPFGGTFLLLYSYFKGVSWSYAEAAKIDGAGNLRIFLQIMLPQAKAGIAAVSFMIAIGVWNDYFTPYMYLPSMHTLATGIQDMSVNARTTGAYTQMFAAMVVATLPIIIIFSFMQKTIINNTIAGGLKG